jgi:hypothetical protein
VIIDQLDLVDTQPSPSVDHSVPPTPPPAGVTIAPSASTLLRPMAQRSARVHAD